ncbi:MAG TPA: cation diffusion facilitator family transporter [Xanthomonadaceae bacterium]|jgi:cation diffusion facilitator family transporter
MPGKPDSLKTIFQALFANLAIFAAKLGAALFTGSGAMLAESVHSLADCGNQVLLLYGVRQAQRPASPDYPLGHGREIYFWSFLVALMLFSVGGIVAVYEGWHKIFHPEPLTQPWWAMFVMLFAIVAEGLSMRTCLQEAEKAREGRSLWKWFRQSRQSELIVIFGENLADLLGLAVGLLAVVATMVTGNPVWDAIGTLVIGALLVVVALFVAIEVKALLIGQGVEPAVHRAIYAYFNNRPEIRGVFSLITMQMGEQVMVAVQAEMDFTLRGDELVKQINSVEAGLKVEFPQVRWIFFEPDDSD